MTFIRRIFIAIYYKKKKKKKKGVLTQSNTKGITNFTIQILETSVSNFLKKSRILFFIFVYVTSIKFIVILFSKPFFLLKLIIILLFSCQFGIIFLGVSC
jgi:hypothetical protein